MYNTALVDMGMLDLLAAAMDPRDKKETNISQDTPE